MADFATKTGTGGTVVPNTYDNTPALTDRVPLTGKKEASLQDILDSIDDFSGSAALTSVAGVTAAGAANKRTLVNLTDDLLATTGVPEDISISVNAPLGLLDHTAAADGTTDDAAAIQAMLDAAATTGAKKVVYLRNKKYRIASTLTVPFGVTIKGQGSTTEDGSLNYAATQIIKDFNGVGILLSGTNSGLESLGIVGTTGNTGDGVQITGSRCRLQDVSIYRCGGNGIRIGADSGSFNANLWRIDNVASCYNGGHGCYIHDGTSAGNPLVADVNAGTATALCVDHNTGDGLRLGESIDNVFVNVIAQTNTGAGIRITATAWGNQIFKAYTESNTEYELRVLTGAKQNVIFGNRSENTSSWSFESTEAKTANLITQHRYDGSTTKWFLGRTLAAGDTDASGTGTLEFITGTSVITAASLTGSESTGSGGKLVVQTKRNGNTPVNRMTVDHDGSVYVENSTNGLVVGKTTTSTSTPGIQLGDAPSNSRTNIVAPSGSNTVIAIYEAGTQRGSVAINSGVGVNYNTTSDARLKNVVGDIDDPLGKLAALAPVMFTMKDQPDAPAAGGFLAQDVLQVAPWAVSGDPNGPEPLQLDTSKLVAVLWAAVRELAARS